MNKQFFRTDFLLPYLFNPINNIYRKLSKVHTDNKRYPLALEMLKSKRIVRMINRITRLSLINKKFRNSIYSKITSNIHYELYLWMIYLSKYYLDMWKVLYDNQIIIKPFRIKSEYHTRISIYDNNRHPINYPQPTYEITMLKNRIDYVVLEVKVTRNNKLINHYLLWYDNVKKIQIATGNITPIDKWPLKSCKYLGAIITRLLLLNQLSDYTFRKREPFGYDSSTHGHNSLNYVINVLNLFISKLESS